MSTQLQRRNANPDLELPDTLHPLLQRVYRQRAIENAADLELGLGNLLPPDRIKGMERATELLLDCLQHHKRILVVADFDADGATSCALALTALREFGAAHVDYIVPNRFEYGYGLTPEIVELACHKNPDLIVTVDNGISSIDGVRFAQEAGIQVLITDHHLAPDQLPQADAIVNPNQPGCEFPSKNIAGVGVIFYVMMSLRSRLRELNWFEERNLKEPNLANLLDFVALGTVADVVALDRNNRIMVDEGLKRIRGGRTRPGILALLEISKRKPEKLNAGDLGFSIGPRLNAAGRLDDMSTGIECLLAEHAGAAYELALQLDGMNQDRKQIEADMRDQAFQALDELSLDSEQLPAALCLFDQRWHQGVVGILASRVKDRFHRPVIAFADVSGDDATTGELKGSARSIKGFHIRDALDAVATRHPGLVSKFGGHAMAAGLSLDKNRFDEFKQAFEEEADRLLGPDILQSKILSDGEVAAELLSMETADALSRGGPWGQEFPEPLFDGRFLLLQQRRVGERHLKMVLSPLHEPQLSVDAIAFNVDPEIWPSDGAKEIEIAYRLDINEFRGNTNLQLIVEQVLDSR